MALYPASAAINVKRDSHYIAAGIRTLLLESARTGNTSYPNDLTHADWSKSNIAVTAGIADPAGGTGAFTLTATAANGQITNGSVGHPVITRTTSVWAKRRTGVGTVSMYYSHGSTVLPIAVTNDWQRFYLVAGGSGNRFSGIKLATSGDAVDVYWPQNEDGAYPTSDIPVGGRSVDVPSITGVAVSGATLYQRYYVEPFGTAVLAHAATPYVSGAAIVPALDRAYTHIYVIRGTRTATECRDLLGLATP